MANHRSAGRAAVRKHHTVGRTHRDSAVTSGALKVGVLGVLATATIAAPLAAAAAGVDESVARGETLAQTQLAAVSQPTVGPVALPTATAQGEESEDSDTAAGTVEQASETRAHESASRSEERTAPVDDETADANTADAKTTEGEERETAEGETTEEDEVVQGADAQAAAGPESTDLEVSVADPETAPAVDGAAAADGTTPVPAAGPSGYLQPVEGPITSGFGGRIHPVLGYFKGHNGVDFGAACGTPVAASQSGTVIAVEYNSASGNRVKIDHGDGIITGYFHLQGFNTSVGQTVAQGDIVGFVGTTGRSTGCHLHFSKMDQAGNYSDPMSLLR